KICAIWGKPNLLMIVLQPHELGTRPNKALREPAMMVETLGIHELWLFILSGLLLNVTPGPDTAYIIGRSIQFGWRGGAAAATGISVGCLVHVFGAAIGLSALLMASSAA